MRNYGQFCPIARGSEIFGERWTPVIIRKLYLGCGRFGEILEGGGRPWRAPLETAGYHTRCAVRLSFTPCPVSLP